MCQLNTFIKKQFRPDIIGGTLDKEHHAYYVINQNDSIANAKQISCNAICFGPKKDNVLINIEHAINNEDAIFIFYYEDLHIRWTYCCDNHEIFFIYKKNVTELYKIKPNCVYIRGCYVDVKDEHWKKLGDFFNFVDLLDLKGLKVLCAPNKQLTNESKLYQLSNSLSSNISGNIAGNIVGNISIGHSYVVKGIEQYNLLPKDTSYIVKSLSGVRSIVVDHKNYDHWNFDNIKNIPVLFQEKIVGNDVRVHVLGNQTYTKISNSKENIDYRYDKAFFNLCDVEDLSEQLQQYCLNISSTEKNNFLGIDFIKTDLSYVVLEANPSPGWSAYYPHDGIVVNEFLCNLLFILKSLK